MSEPRTDQRGSDLPGDPCRRCGQRSYFAALEEVGIHYDQVTQQLQEEGVQKFIGSFQKLFQCIDNKRKVLQQERGV